MGGNVMQSNTMMIARWTNKRSSKAWKIIFWDFCFIFQKKKKFSMWNITSNMKVTFLFFDIKK